MSKQTLVLDSSQISTWDECPEKWNLTNIVNITKDNRPDDPIAAGSLMHKYLEIYYRSLGAGHLITEAVRQAKAFDPDAEDEADNHSYPLDLELRKKVRDRFDDYWMLYGSGKDYTPLVKYENSISIDPVSGLPVDSKIKNPLVEQGFSYKLFESSEYLFVLEGRIDFIGETAGTSLWMDHKLQFRERELYKKSIQFRNYSLATGLNLGVINYIRMHKDINVKTFVRQPISFSTQEMRMWKSELISMYVDFAKQLQDPDVKYHMQRKRSACGGKFGYPCPFTVLCDEYEYRTQLAIRERDFVQRHTWRPW